MIILERGKPYPLPIVAKDGAAAQFLIKSGNILQVVLSDMNKEDEQALRYGEIKAEFLYKEGALLWLFLFHDKRGNKLFTLDAPFDARLIPDDVIELHNIDNKSQRLAVELHGIDGSRILKAIRLITLPNDLTLDFLAAVQQQLSTIENPSVMQDWMLLTPAELSNNVTMKVLGK